MSPKISKSRCSSMFEYEFRAYDEKSGIKAGELITTDFGSISTPTRIMTTKELKNISVVKETGHVDSNIDKALPYQIFEVTKTFKMSTLKNLKPDKDVFHVQANKMEPLTEPVQNKLKTFKAIYSQKLRLTKAINEGLLALQIHAKINLITSDIRNHIPLNKVDDWLSHTVDYVTGEIGNLNTAQIIPIVDMNMDEIKFSQIIQKILDKDFIGFGVKYVSPFMRIANYRTVRKITKNNPDKFVFMFDVPRKAMGKNNKFSTFHLFQLIGAEGFSLGKNFIPPDVPYSVELEKAKRFDPRNLAVLTRLEYVKLNKTTQIDDCMVCEGKTINTFFGKYDKWGCLPEAISSHESITSYMEFLKSRMSVLQGEFGKYAKSKKIFSQYASKLFGYSPDQSRFQRVRPVL